MYLINYYSIFPGCDFTSFSLCWLAPLLRAFKYSALQEHMRSKRKNSETWLRRSQYLVSEELSGVIIHVNRTDILSQRKTANSIEIVSLRVLLIIEEFGIFYLMKSNPDLRKAENYKVVVVVVLTYFVSVLIDILSVPSWSTFPPLPRDQNTSLLSWLIY